MKPGLKQKHLNPTKLQPKVDPICDAVLGFQICGLFVKENYNCNFNVSFLHAFWVPVLVQISELYSILGKVVFSFFFE